MDHSDNNMPREQQLSQLMDGEWHALNPSECVANLCEDQALRERWTRYHMIRDVIRNEPLQADAELVSRICSLVDDEPSYTNITPFAGSRRSTIPAVDAMTHPASHSSGSHRDSDDTVFVADKDQPVVQRAFNGGIAGFAVAASVALLSVVAVNMNQQSQPESALVATVDSEQREATPSVNNPAQAGVRYSLGVRESGETGRARTDTVRSFVSLDAPTVRGSTQAAFQSAGSALTASSSGLQFFQNPRMADNVRPVTRAELASSEGVYWVSPNSAQRVSDEQRLNRLLSQHIENSPTARREGLLPYSRLVGYDAVSAR